MKISKNTFNILKNYSTINPSVLVEAGNVISTMSPQKTILSYCELEETFPVDFAIYDLGRFLQISSLFEDPEFVFQNDRLTISGEKHEVTYRYAEPDMIITPPKKKLELPEEGQIVTHVTWADFGKMMRGASILQKPEVQIRATGDGIFLEAVDTKDMSGDNYSIELNALGNSDTVGTFIFKIENLKLIEGDYAIKLSPKGMAEFVNQTTNINYFIALQAN